MKGGIFNLVHAWIKIHNAPKWIDLISSLNKQTIQIKARSERKGAMISPPLISATWKEVFERWLEG
jgi:hypothetical protein